MGILQGWIDNTEKAISQQRGFFPDDKPFRYFLDSYSGLIEQARRQEGDIEERLLRLAQSLCIGSKKITEEQLLSDYIGALSVDLDPVTKKFLPSFSDECLTNSVGSKNYPSPFRGLTIAWQMGEIAYEMKMAYLMYQGRKSTQENLQPCFDKLMKFYSDALVPLKQQQSGTSSEYHDYYDALEMLSQRSADSLPLHSRWLGELLEREIAFQKHALFEVVIPFKDRWTRHHAYPCRTSTHFYLSGIRFYYTPLTHTSYQPEGSSLYCVHSTDSGLFIPSERYGMLCPEDASLATVEELVHDLPTGGLMLDYSDYAAAGAAGPTELDRKSLRYFERWSRLLTSKAYAIVSEVLDMWEYSQKRGSKGPVPIYQKTSPARLRYISAAC